MHGQLAITGSAGARQGGAGCFRVTRALASLVQQPIAIPFRSHVSSRPPDGATRPRAPATESRVANANWEGTPGFGVVLTDQSGAASWPLAGATFILMHKQPKDTPAAAEALKFFAWAYAKGDKMAEDLDYVPMPDKVVGAIEKVWSAQIKDAGGKPLFALSN